MSDEEFLTNLKDIDNEKLIQSLQNCGHDGYYNDLYYPIMKEIKRRLSSASAKQEQSKGEWNFIGDNMFECTHCGVVYTTQQLNGLRNYDVDPYAPRFCPCCGACMANNDE